eukprot:204350-Chlamydomonas_euryale.AAC.2
MLAWCTAVPAGARRQPRRHRRPARALCARWPRPHRRDGLPAAALDAARGADTCAEAGGRQRAAGARAWAFRGGPHVCVGIQSRVWIRSGVGIRRQRRGMRRRRRHRDRRAVDRAGLVQPVFAAGPLSRAARLTRGRGG